jgi:hypothetical protein
LLAVVALPRYFVFRLSLDDPHPVPWLRVKLSCALGRALYPHPQWDEMERVWATLYPPPDAADERRGLFELLTRTMPGLAGLLANHRPSKLRGASLAEALRVHERTPARLAAYWQTWLRQRDELRRAPPSLAFAVIGQARAEGRLTPEAESRLLTKLLRYWALRGALEINGRSPRVSKGV